MHVEVKLRFHRHEIGGLAAWRREGVHHVTEKRGQMEGHGAPLSVFVWFGKSIGSEKR